MKVYTVHEPNEPTADRIDRAEHLAFVADGFHWLAAAFAPLAFVSYNLWLGLAIYIAALAALAAVLSALGAHASWIALAVIALHVIVGFEFNQFRRTALDAKGWSNIGIVTGRNRYECERRFLEGWLPRQPVISGLRSAREAVPAPQSTSLPAVAAGPKTRRWLWKS